METYLVCRHSNAAVWEADKRPVTSYMPDRLLSFTGHNMFAVSEEKNSPPCIKGAVCNSVGFELS